MSPTHPNECPNVCTCRFCCLVIIVGEFAVQEMAYAGQSGVPSNGLSVLGSDDEESLGRDLKDMLKDGAQVQDVDGDLSVQGDIGTGMACVGGSAGMAGSQSYRPSSLPSGIAGGYMRPQPVPPGESIGPVSK